MEAFFFVPPILSMIAVRATAAGGALCASLTGWAGRNTLRHAKRWGMRDHFDVWRWVLKRTTLN
jgi:hypothetical protein